MTAPPAVVPVYGLRFEHARFLRKVPGAPVREWPPEVFVVTRVTRTTVYYGAADTPAEHRRRKGSRASHYIARDGFATIVGRVLGKEEA